MDLATPKLALACANGTHIDTITIDLCRAGKDNVTINYGKVEWCYTRQNRAGGGVAGNSAAGWDLQRNRRV